MGCATDRAPSRPVDVAAWSASGDAIDSLSSLDRIDDALSAAHKRDTAVNAPASPQWMRAEARDTERSLERRAAMRAADRQALASADREFRIARDKASGDSVTAALRLLRAVMETRGALLGPRDARTAAAAFELAAAELAAAHPGEADSLARQAGATFLATLGPWHPRCADAEELRGRILKNYTGQIAADEIAAHYVRALEIRTANEGAASLAVADCHQDLGNLERLRQRAPAAMRHFRRALEIRRARLGAVDDRVASAYGAMAFLSAGRGEWAAAESLARAAVTATPVGPGTPRNALSIRMSLSGQALRHLGRNSEAEPILRRTVAMREAAWARVSQDEGSTIVAGLSLYRDLALTLAAMGRDNDAFDQLERGSARVLAMRLAAGSEAAEDPWRDLLGRVQRTLKPDEALVSWPHSASTLFVADTPMYACIVRATGSAHWVRLDSPAPKFAGSGTIREALWREFLANAEWPRRITDTTTVCRLAHLMWRERVAPLEPFLRGVTHLIVCSPDYFAGGPLGVIIDDHGHYLAERFTISYVPSAFVLARLRSRRTASRDAPLSAEPALLVGDPAYAQSNAEHWPRLAASGPEVRGLAALLPRATVLTGMDASAARLRSLAERGALLKFRFIHFSAHTNTNDSRVLASSFVLAPNSPGSANSRLDSREIIGQWKLGAAVVSLAGCHSIAGLSSESEGAQGLPQAFLAAGARSLLVTMWAVDDQATSLLMEFFVQRLTERSHPLDAATALRESQLELRDWRAPDGSRPYAHPVYWGAFALLGDGDVR